MAESGGRGQSNSDTESFKFVIVGGGIAGVTCAETVRHVMNKITVHLPHLFIPLYSRRTFQRTFIYCSSPILAPRKNIF